MNWDFIYRGESQSLDDNVRAVLDGSFVHLPEGWTHYQIAGPKARHPVVLVHGFTIPYFIWDPTFQVLIAEGFRTLRYDLYGRGYSDRPHLQYDLSLFVRQLENLLDELGSAKIDLVGLSMGGAIASAFTTRWPERVRRLVLIDPIGTLPMPLNWLYRFAFLPGVGEILLGMIGNERLIKGAASDLFDASYVDAFEEKFRMQMPYRGFKRAILSTLRNGVVGGFPKLYRDLGDLEIPVLLIWGRNDRMLPIAQSESLLALLPRAEFHVVEDCGHIPHFEKPEVVNPLLLQFLS